MEIMKRLLTAAGMAAALFGQPANWPAVLEADVNSGSWAAAERVGQATVEEIDAGRMFARFADAAEDAKVRRFYADALEHMGNAEQARQQRCLAGQILDPVPDAPCGAQAAVQRTRRVGNLKADLLSTEVNQPTAPLPFAQDGRVLVVAFWATWCAPCARELDLLRRYANSEAKLLPIDVAGINADVRTRFVLPESLEGPEIPQLYVFDTHGNIRFHIRGFEDDGFFSQKLDWMIEAALK
jgi:thiol-disulfide isomerase/thioredoxin